MHISWSTFVNDVIFAMVLNMMNYVFNFLGILAHEYGHVICSGGRMKEMQIGLQTRQLAFTMGRITIYPILPVCGQVCIQRVSGRRLNHILGHLGGPLAGCLFGIAVFAAGYYMIPEGSYLWYRHYGHTFHSFVKNISHNQGLYGDIAFCLLAIGLGLVVGHLGNLIPFRHSDGWKLRRTFRKIRRSQQTIGQ